MKIPNRDFPLSPTRVERGRQFPGQVGRDRIAVHFTSGLNGDPLPATRTYTIGEARLLVSTLITLLGRDA